MFGILGLLVELSTDQLIAVYDLKNKTNFERAKLLIKIPIRFCQSFLLSVKMTHFIFSCHLFYLQLCYLRLTLF